MDSVIQVHHLLIAIFIGGYIFIALESFTQLNKATAALLMAVFSWVLEYLNPLVTFDQNQQFLTQKLGEISQLIFFLMGALTVVEVISAHKGFKILTDLIRIRSKRGFLWTVSILTFFLSAALDNMTTTLVMVAIIMHLVHEHEERLFFGAAVVIAANAGGVWTPIGDVTTTMLWIGGQISLVPTVRDLFLPSLASLLVSLLILSMPLKGKLKDLDEGEEEVVPISKLVFFVGIGAIIFVPFFKELTGLPPFMGMFLGLATLWIVTDIAHRNRAGYDHLRVPQILSRVDMSSVLFFLGILLTVDALEVAGVLSDIQKLLERYIPNQDTLVVVIGFLSAVVDNVPLVAATQAMYSLQEFKMDDELWQLIAYVAGTGGNILVIGSAAGVAYMGLTKAGFMWWVRRITFAALAGYFAGIGIYWLQLLL